MKVLVTGVAGFIGSHLAERLVREGHDVVGLDCFTDYYDIAFKQLNRQQVENAGVEFIEADLAEAALAPQLQSVDFLFHLAAQPGISATTGFEAYVRNNLLATNRLVEAVLETRQLRGFLNIATSSIYGADATGSETSEPRPTSHYGVTKLAAEQLVMAAHRDHGLPACSLRLFSVYGPRERPEKLYPKLIHAILTDTEFPLYEGSEGHLRSYTYVNDIVDGMIKAMERFGKCNGQVINLGLDASITTGEGIRIVEGVLGRRARKKLLPRRHGDQTRTHADIRKARKLLDYKPRTGPHEGLEAEVRWFVESIAFRA